MSDERDVSGWLPPRAPGGQPPPRFEPGPPEPEPPAAPGGWAPPGAGPGTPPAATAPHAGAPPALADRPPANKLAIASLVLGIAGIGLLALSLGLSFIFSLPLSGAGWVCAQQARTRLREGRERTGDGQAKAGLILGIGGVALGVVATIVWIALIASGFSVEEFRQELERELERQRNGDARAALEALRAAAHWLPFLGR